MPRIERLIFTGNPRCNSFYFFAEGTVFKGIGGFEEAPGSCASCPLSRSQTFMGSSQNESRPPFEVHSYCTYTYASCLPHYSVSSPQTMFGWYLNHVRSIFRMHRHNCFACMVLSPMDRLPFFFLMHPLILSLIPEIDACLLALREDTCEPCKSLRIKNLAFPTRGHGCFWVMGMAPGLMHNDNLTIQVLRKPRLQAGAYGKLFTSLKSER